MRETLTPSQLAALAYYSPMRFNNDFDQKLSFSLGERENFDMNLIRKALAPSCVSVEKTDAETDKTGVDYIATLRRGATILIDAKSREKGSSRFWKNGEPELALEKWSVYPDPWQQGKAGWTLNEKRNTDMILYTFDPSDTRTYYLLPFHHLRMAFMHNLKAWEQRYGLKKQVSRRWRSEAVFVPAGVVLDAIRKEMQFAA